MSRIRSIKPSFFRHEKLQELGPLSMLIFSGLWTQCDKAGRFPWKPRTLKLDILPFMDFDMEKELTKLADHFFVIKYESDKEFFGVIPTFADHQRVSGKEALEPVKYPDPPEAKTKRPKKLTVVQPGTNWGQTEKQSGSNGEASEQHLPGQEGKGVQEGSRVGRATRFTPPSVDEVSEYCRIRRNRVKPEKFLSHYESNGWRVGKNPMKDWRAAVRTWETNDTDRNSTAESHSLQPDFRGLE